VKRRAALASAFAVLATAGGSAWLAAGCDGQGPSTGIDEPITVTGGQFISGDLPGTPEVLDAGPPAADATPPFSIQLLNFANQEIFTGQSGVKFSGDVTGDSVAVGMRLPQYGTGYWVVPVGTPDLQMPGSYSFGIGANFDPSLPPGPIDARFVAIGLNGEAGEQKNAQLCVDSRIPDNGHACTPELAKSLGLPPLPPAVFTLTWDTGFDLDLDVVTSTGLSFSAKRRFGTVLDSGTGKPPADLPRIDRDSMAGCVQDGFRQEDLVFPKSIDKGIYDIYVDPYAACGQNAVHWTFTVYQPSGTCPNCTLSPTYTRNGELLASQVTGGTGSPLFVAEIPFE
jgi:hypothetical protein